MATPQSIDLFQTESGEWHKVELSTTSVLDALKWRTGEYKVSVQNDVPLPVPGLKMWSFNNWQYCPLYH